VLVTAPPPTAAGRPLDTTATAFGELRTSDDAVDDGVELRRRLDEHGYLFIPGYLDRAEVLGARRELLDRLAQLGWLDPGHDVEDAVPTSGKGTPYGMNELARSSPALMAVLYGRRMIALFDDLFGDPVRHFDFTWLRVVGPGRGTLPHMDNVFMNRGTPKLLTAWTPLGDIDTTLGGVAVLEGSHRLDDIIRDYATRDVDTYCANSADPDELAKAESGLPWGGTLTDDPIALREQLGLRWLTRDYAAGDLLVFTMHTAHLGLDNNTTDRFRLSSDSRYQPASEPADPRWIGANPSAHGPDSKRGLIC
jgi:hypothetical protein